MATAQLSWLPKDEGHPYFTLIHKSASSARACCARARGAGTLRRDDIWRARQPLCRGQSESTFSRLRMRFLRRLRASLPQSDVNEKKVIEKSAKPENRRYTTCRLLRLSACSFKAEMRGEELVRHGVP